MRHRLSMLVVIGLLAACGGGDDDAVPAANEPSAGSDDAPADEPDEDTDGDASLDDSDSDPADDTGDDDAAAGDDTSGGGDDGDDSNPVSISDLDDIPDECRQIMGDFLREIEPLVEDVDWENSTLQEVGDLMTSIDQPSTDITAEMSQAGCDNIDFDGDDESGFELTIELARQEAPGTVGWLEFIRDLSDGFDPTGTPDESADAPDDCDGAIAAVRDLMSEYSSMTELPAGELIAATTTLQSVTTLCTGEEMTALFADPEFQEWTG